MFRVSTTDVEGHLNVSKWLHIQLLLDSTEMRDMLNEMGEFLIVHVGAVMDPSQVLLSRDEFLRVYDEYVGTLKLGQDPPLLSYLSTFSCALSLGEEEFYAMQVGPSQLLIKPILPVVQMQAHTLGYSAVDEQIYPMARGSDTITWGIQLSFPTLFQAKKKAEPSNTLTDASFRNAKLFQSIQKWVRLHTRPTPMFLKQKKINLPVRIGNQCFSWINNHPMLRFHGLLIDSEGDEG